MCNMQRISESITASQHGWLVQSSRCWKAFSWEACCLSWRHCDKGNLQGWSEEKMVLKLEIFLRTLSGWQMTTLWYQPSSWKSPICQHFPILRPPGTYLKHNISQYDIKVFRCEVPFKASIWSKFGKGNRDSRVFLNNTNTNTNTNTGILKQ